MNLNFSIKTFPPIDIEITPSNYYKYKKNFNWKNDELCEFKDGNLIYQLKPKEINKLKRIKQQLELEFIKNIENSSEVFKNTVWPEIRKLPIINGGSIQSVEEKIINNTEKEYLDLYAGIDAWHIKEEKLRGIASRVGFKRNFETFTFGSIEFEKRFKAIEKIAEGWIFPHLTVQAYVDEKKI